MCVFFLVLYTCLGVLLCFLCVFDLFDLCLICFIRFSFGFVRVCFDFEKYYVRTLVEQVIKLHAPSPLQVFKEFLAMAKHGKQGSATKSQQAGIILKPDDVYLHTPHHFQLLRK